MKIFLSSLECGGETGYILERAPFMLWNLCSYYYLRCKDISIYAKIVEKSREVLVDSGAHSFQKGTEVKWDEYTRQYADFIRSTDCDKVLGYFEMDVDNIIGYDKVKQLRRILESATDKIIPVWHRGRGIQDFHDMCDSHKGKIVAITGFKNEDIRDDQYAMFLKTAWKYGCKVHCLGMTRRKILDTVPFDTVDSSSWCQSAIYGKTCFCKKRIKKGTHNVDEKIVGYEDGIKMQMHYYKKWRSVNND